MEFNDVVQARYSCRAYLDKPVSAETVRHLAELAQRAPSWGNTQPWKTYVVGGETGTKLRDDMAEALTSGQAEKPDVEMPATFTPELGSRYKSLGKDLFAWLGLGREDKEARLAHYVRNFRGFDAPVQVFVTVPKGETPYVIYDAGAYVAQFCLAAADQGLATCILAALARFPEVVRKYVPMGDDELLVIGFTLGYPNPEHKAATFRCDRLPLDQVATMVDLA